MCSWINHSYKENEKERGIKVELTLDKVPTAVLHGKPARVARTAFSREFDCQLSTRRERKKGKRFRSAASAGVRLRARTGSKPELVNSAGWRSSPGRPLGPNRFRLLARIAKREYNISR